MGLLRARRVSASAGAGEPRTVGSRASKSWLDALGVGPPGIRQWHVEISLATLDVVAPLNFDERSDSRFHVDIYAEEWGFFFCHAGRTSWIRVTDIAFVHGRDEFSLLAQAPTLADIGALLRGLENQHQLAFRRKHALVRTNIAGAEPGIRRWVEKF